MLLIDLGNSQIKLAWYHQGELHRISACRYDSDADFKACFDKVRDTPEEIFIASVITGQSVDYVNELCWRRWEVNPQRLETQRHCCGVVNRYKKFERLGVDRWAAMIGARQVVDGAFLLVDCGTACTADIVNSKGEFLGGAVVPGLSAMVHTLNQKTDAINTETQELSALKPGLNTEDCVALGVIEALCGFIDRMSTQARDAVKTEITVIVTGGDAPTLLPHLCDSVRYEKELVFLGMAGMVAQKGE